MDSPITQLERFMERQRVINEQAEAAVRDACDCWPRVEPMGGHEPTCERAQNPSIIAASKAGHKE